jgi:hypothetical protein
LRSGIVAKRGKSFKASKFGACSLEFVFAPAIIVLHVGGGRGLSMSADGVAAGELTGKESSCCCVGLGTELVDG